MKCAHCGHELPWRFDTLPDPLDKHIRETDDVNDLRRLCIIRSSELTKARAQRDVLREMLMEASND